ncbi:MAG: hypothetical protein LBV32_00765, partial [Tannerellaceae bacterium]|nr:hypothetical protein [Tannerellaceae bacterium]
MPPCLAVSVHDRVYANPADPVNMLIYCYLSSQIRRKIYNPAYYFNEENKNRMESLNLLLKVQDTEDYVWDTGTAYNGQPFLTDEITG